MNKIRNATILDLNRIFEIETSCFPIKEAATKTSLKERILTFEEGFMVITNEKEIIGFINGAATNRDKIIDPMYESMKEYHNPRGKNIAIYGVDIHPEYQGKGYSKILMNAFIEEARKNKREKIILTCKEHLVSYYEQFGYKCEGVSSSVHGGAKWYDMSIQLNMPYNESSIKKIDKNMLKDKQHLLVRLDLKNYKVDGTQFKRIAVRGVIKRGDKYAMIHSSKYGEYKFPGGGMKDGEKLIDTLSREVMEETGLKVKLSSVKYIGRTEEIRKGEISDVFFMVSHYFECQVMKEIGQQNLDDYEKEYGYKLEYVSLSHAIKCNEAIKDISNIPWVERDTKVMKILRDIEF